MKVAAADEYVLVSINPGQTEHILLNNAVSLGKRQKGMILKILQVVESSKALTKLLNIITDKRYLSII